MFFDFNAHGISIIYDFLAIIDPMNFDSRHLSLPIGIFYYKSDCLNKCLGIFNCIQYVYFLNNGSCYLMFSYDPVNSEKNANVVSKFIKCKIASKSSNFFLIIS